MTLSISILGSLLIESNECRFERLPKKARALLAFLAVQGGQAVSRERLADLLWPYQGSEQAVIACATACWSCAGHWGPPPASTWSAIFPTVEYSRLSSISIGLSSSPVRSIGLTCRRLRICIEANFSPISTSVPSRSRNGWGRSAAARSA